MISSRVQQQIRMSNPASPVLSPINTSNITGDVALASPEISPIRGSHNASSMLPDHPIHEGGRPQPTVNPGNHQKALVPLLEALKYGTKQMAMHKVSCAHFSHCAGAAVVCTSSDASRCNQTAVPISDEWHNHQSLCHPLLTTCQRSTVPPSRVLCAWGRCNCMWNGSSQCP